MGFDFRISPKGLRLGENEALFDRKLLEYLHEQGVRKNS